MEQGSTLFSDTADSLILECWSSLFFTQSLSVTNIPTSTSPASRADSRAPSALKYSTLLTSRVHSLLHGVLCFIVLSILLPAPATSSVTSCSYVCMWCMYSQYTVSAHYWTGPIHNIGQRNTARHGTCQRSRDTQCPCGRP